MIRITLPDGSEKKARPGACVCDIAGQIDRLLGEAPICASVNGELRSMYDQLTEDCQVTFHTSATRQGRMVLHHTAAHLIAQAVKRLFPAAVLGTGHPTENGFYHDVEIGRPFSSEELRQIEAESTRIIDEDLPIVRCKMSKEGARTLLIRRGDILRLELLAALPDATLSLYRQGEYVEFCRGPHLVSTGKMPQLRIHGLEAVSWLDDPHAEHLNRIHGMIA